MTIFVPNMNQENAPNNKSDFSRLKAQTPDKKDEEIATLQDAIVNAKNSLLEIHFLYILVIIIIVDIIAFSNMETWGGPISILFLEIVLLVVLGRRLGVDDVKVLTERFIDMWNRNKTG